jgi:regulator of protease activity HflC (stomatin/prohibitin superfamily)
MNRYRGAGNRPATFLMMLFFVLAAVVLSQGPREPALVAIAIVLAVIGVFIPQSLMIANQWERAVVLRMGRLQAIKGPGVFWIAPIIDRVATWLDQRIQTTEFNAEQALSKDTVPVNIDAVVFWQIHDAERAALEIADYRSGIARVAQTSLREMVGSSLLTTLLSDRKHGDEVLREEIARKIADWGIAVLSVEIRDISVPAALQDAMSRQAQAERERLARVLLGQAEQEVAIKFVEAAEIYARSPAALQLRAMNIIYETTKERGATILMPSAMVDAMNPGAILGLAALAGGAPPTAAPEAATPSAGAPTAAARARTAAKRPPASD